MKNYGFKRMLRKTLLYSGYINEKDSKENLPGVTVYVPKLKVVTTSIGNVFKTGSSKEEGYQNELTSYSAS